MLQRTKEWKEARLGRFTASKASELLTNGRRDMTEEELADYKKREPKGRRKTIDCIGESLYTYALKAAAEDVMGADEEDDFVSFDMKRGIALEPVAFAHFKAKKELEFLDVTEVGFVPYKSYAGASADGYVSDNSGLEIKCPKRGLYLALVTKGIEAIKPEYIDQMQMQMLCTDTKQTYFYAYYESNGKAYGHEIIVKRDEERIKLLKERLMLAHAAKLKYREELIKNQK